MHGSLPFSGFGLGFTTLMPVHGTRALTLSTTSRSDILMVRRVPPSFAIDILPTLSKRPASHAISMTRMEDAMPPRRFVGRDLDDPFARADSSVDFESRLNGDSGTSTSGAGS